ncbi:hypothetical protein FRB90_011223 [Tulasnella sp. 427]|nr:hypothetical protein FRB90_011223 [Tulasnella sp. 427]
MLDFRSFRVSIRADHQDLPIFQPEYDEDTKTATCWIPSEEGQTFSIYGRQDKSFPHYTSARIFLDGSKQPIERILWGKDQGYTMTVGGVNVSRTARRPFQFARLETTDDDSYLDQPLTLKAPGTIRIEMYRVRVTGESSWQGPAVDDTSCKVHEKSKKAGAHITRLGKQEVSRPRTRSIQTKPYSSSDALAWVSFEFRYRPAGGASIAILQAEGIMPKPNVSRPLVDRSGTDSADEEMEAQHKAAILALEAEQAALDLRRAVLNAKAVNKKLKREPSPIRVTSNGVGEVIDLTLDD